MALVLHNATVIHGTLSTTNAILLHTATAGSTLLVWTQTDEATSISSVNAGANALTRLQILSVGAAQRMELWGLTAPGSGVLSISARPVAVMRLAMIATTYVGQRTTATPFGGTTGVTIGSTTSINFSISTDVGNLGVFAFGRRNTDDIILNNGTHVASATTTTTSRVLVGSIAGGTTTVSATAANAAVWGAMGIHLIASAEGAAVITGSMSATDAPDTFAATGNIIVSGRVSATDAQDVFAATGQVIISGRVSATDVADTFLASAQTIISGRMSATDAQDIFAATSTLPTITGSMSATDAPDTFAATGLVRVTGTLAATDVQDTFAASGYVKISGFISATDAPDIFAATGTVEEESSGGSSSVSAVVALITDPGAGSGKGHDDYIPANWTFWEAREKYLRTLHPEIEAEPGPEIFPEPIGTVEPAPVPLLLGTLRFERREALESIEQARNMRQLRAAGKRLRLINQRILEQKKVELAAAREQVAAIQYELDAPKRARDAKIARLRRALTTLELARQVLHLTDYR